MKKVILTLALVISSVSVMAQSNQSSCQNVDPDTEMNCEIAKAQIKRDQRMLNVIIHSITYDGVFQQTWLSNLVDRAEKENKNIITSTVATAIKKQTSVTGLKNLLTVRLEASIPVLYNAILFVKQTKAVQKIATALTSTTGLADPTLLQKFFECAGFNENETQRFVQIYENITKEELKDNLLRDLAWEAPAYAKKCVQ